MLRQSPTAILAGTAVFVILTAAVVIGLFIRLDLVYEWIWPDAPARQPSPAFRVIQEAEKALEAGDVSAAIKLSEDARRLDPHVLSSHLVVVRAQAKAKEYEAALQSTEEGLRHFPGSWALWEERGDLLVALGSYSEALIAYENCVARRPLGYWEPWLKLAKVQELLGDRHAAAQTYRDLLVLFPGNREASRELERLKVK